MQTADIFGVETKGRWRSFGRECPATRVPADSASTKCLDTAVLTFSAPTEYPATRVATLSVPAECPDTGVPTLSVGTESWETPVFARFLTINGRFIQHLPLAATTFINSPNKNLTYGTMDSLKQPL